MAARFIRMVAAEDGRPRGAVVGLAALVALLSASCCVLPIGLSIIGFGGAWLSVLGPFAAYRSTILVVVGAVLIWAWFRLISRSQCEGWKRGPVTLTALASLAFAIAASSPVWEEGLTNIMWRVSQ